MQKYFERALDGVSEIKNANSSMQAALLENFGDRDLMRRRVRNVSLLYSFWHGFERVTAHRSGIKCEMLFYVMYYRVGLTTTLWMPFLFDVVVGLLSGVLRSLGRSYKRHQARRSDAEVRHVSEGLPRGLNPEAESLTLAARRHLVIVALGIIDRLIAAVCLNLFCWIAVSVFQWGDHLEVAISDYLFGFMQDVFGWCAAGGYYDAWNYDCIPFTLRHVF